MSCVTAFAMASQEKATETTRSTEHNYKTSLNATSLKNAVCYLNEDPDTRHIEVKVLRDRLDKLPGLKARLDTPFLLRFLRARKFNQEEAFQLVLNYYRIRTEDPDIFNELVKAYMGYRYQNVLNKKSTIDGIDSEALKPSFVRHVFECGYTTPLGVRDKAGAAVIVERPGKWEYSRFSSMDLIKADIITVTKVIEDEETQVYGITLIVDYQDFTFSHFTHNATAFASRLCKLWQDVFPARLKAVHIVNEPSSFSSIFSIFKAFLKPKLLSRVRFHGRDYKTLHEHIHPCVLPQCYGGTQAAIPDTTWCDFILSCDAQFEADNKYGFVDMLLGSESKSDDKGVAGTNLAGTFKKLTVD